MYRVDHLLLDLGLSVPPSCQVLITNRVLESGGQLTIPDLSTQVGEEISNQSVMDTALLYLRHLPDIPEDFVALAPFAVIKSFLRHPEKFNFRSFRSNCGLGAVERERALLLIAVKFVKFDMENRLPVMTQLLGELRLAYFADEVEAMIQDNLGSSFIVFYILTNKMY